MCELAAELKSNGKTVHQRLDELFVQFGYHREHLLNVRMEGSDGMKKMQALMGALREKAPETLGGLTVIATEDYLTNVRRMPDGSEESIAGPASPGNLLIFELEQSGCRVAIRPSGTEPKIKCYIFTAFAPAADNELATTKKSGKKLIEQLCADLEELAK